MADLSTWSDIINDAMGRCRIATTDVSASVKFTVWGNERYQEVAFQEEWPWLRGTDATIHLAANTTGTVSVTNNAATVVGTGTDWSATHAGWKFRTGSEEDVYVVSTVNSATNILLADTYLGSTDSTESFTLWNDSFLFGATVDKIIEVYHYRTDGKKNVEAVSPRDLQVLQTGDPTFETKAGVWAYGEYNATGQRTIEVYPGAPDEDYLLYYEYLKGVTSLSATSDVPLIPKKYRKVLVYGMCADYYDSVNNESQANKFEAKFKDMLNRMDQDSESGTERPQIVHSIPDGSWRRRQSRRFRHGNNFDKF